MALRAQDLAEDGREVRAGEYGSSGSRVRTPGADGSLQEGSARYQGASLKVLNERGLAERRAEIKEMYRVDPEKVLAEMSEAGFSSNRWTRRYVREAMQKTRLSEAQSSSAFSQVLRYGITKLAGEGYELEPSTYENDIAEVVPSKGFENYYAPFFRPQRGGPVARGQSYPAVKMSALDVTIRNFKFGALLEIEKELIDDDQTGQVMQQGMMIGESLSYEVDMYGYLQMANATWLTSVSLNPGAISTPQVSEAHRLLRKVHDPNGNLLVVRPDTLLVDTDEEIPAIQILDSLVAAQNPGSTPAAGSVIYFGTLNPLRGKYKLVATPWVTEALKTPTNPNGYGTDNATPAKWLMRAKRRIIFQTREPLKVVQEAANAGADFEKDTVRFKGNMRFGAAVVDSRFSCRLN